MDADAFARAVQLEDTSTLVQLPGVGRKTAERLLMEMRDRLGHWMPESAGARRRDGAAAAQAGMLAEAESALVALGYKPAEASRAARAADDGSAAGSEELIRRALQSMVKR